MMISVDVISEMKMYNGISRIDASSLGEMSLFSASCLVQGETYAQPSQKRKRSPKRVADHSVSGINT